MIYSIRQIPSNSEVQRMPTKLTLRLPLPGHSLPGEASEQTLAKSSNSICDTSKRHKNCHYDGHAEITLTRRAAFIYSKQHTSTSTMMPWRRCDETRTSGTGIAETIELRAKRVEKIMEVRMLVPQVLRQGIQENLEKKAESLLGEGVMREVRRH
ncbi:uncharacterized protein EI90DRAFT_3073644 [Cantharellus anzutake]|uniref:uncharacterized protein n=1 Tax=Cantharellus anzutake TaxID=1750568 RepID=UPI001906770B|nr:uncharacterized protein EI90DRAFT_3073644 [Cantharellus anzutake]KAF8325268.1 hypothetical protein EI90DRAFT_3073644 [Cantharellus anzutake]